LHLRGCERISEADESGFEFYMLGNCVIVDYCYSIHVKNLIWLVGQAFERSNE